MINNRGLIGSVGTVVCMLLFNHHASVTIVGLNPTKVETKSSNFILKDGGCIE